MTLLRPLVALGFVVLCLAPTLASAQCAKFSVSDATGQPGDTVTLEVTLDHTCTPCIDGWTFGVCHDATVVSLGNPVEGTTAMTANGGNPVDFAAIGTVPGQGWNMGAVISLLGQNCLPPGVGYQLAVADYTILGNGPTMICFCMVGSPPVGPAEVVIGGGVQAAATNCGTISTGPPAACAKFGLGSASGNIGDTVTVGVTLDTTCSPCIQGWSFGICEPPSVALNAITDGTTTQTVNGGGPPAFQAATLVPGGLTVGVVIDLFGVNCLAPGANYDLHQVTLTLLGPPGTDPLCFCNTLGTPPVDTVYVANGVQSTPDLNCGSVTTLGDLFIRADCNADGVVNIADAIGLIGILFPSPPPGTPPLCADACDCNDDETLNIADVICILNSLFGNPPGTVSPPSPGCGVDPSGAALDCASFPPC